MHFMAGAGLQRESKSSASRKAVAKSVFFRNLPQLACAHTVRIHSHSRHKAPHISKSLHTQQTQSSINTRRNPWSTCPLSLRVSFDLLPFCLSALYHVRNPQWPTSQELYHSAFLSALCNAPLTRLFKSLTWPTIRTDVTCDCDICMVNIYTRPPSSSPTVLAELISKQNQPQEPLTVDCYG